MRDTDVPVETRSENLTASPEILSLADGRDIPVRIRHSRRARRILLHVGVYDGKVEIVLPPGASAPKGWGSPPHR